MFSKILNIAKSSLFWMKTGMKNPFSKGTKYEVIDENTNHFRSKKFTLVFVALIVILFFYFSSVGILILLPKVELISAFVTIFSKIMEVIAWIVTFWLAGQSVVDLKYNNTTNIEYKAENKVVKETIEEKHEYIDQSRGRFDFEMEDDSYDQ